MEVARGSVARNLCGGGLNVVVSDRPAVYGAAAVEGDRGLVQSKRHEGGDCGEPSHVREVVANLLGGGGDACHVTVRVRASCVAAEKLQGVLVGGAHQSEELDRRVVIEGHRYPVSLQAFGAHDGNVGSVALECHEERNLGPVAAVVAGHRAPFSVAAVFEAFHVVDAEARVRALLRWVAGIFLAFGTQNPEDGLGVAVGELGDGGWLVFVARGESVEHVQCRVAVLGEFAQRGWVAFGEPIAVVAPLPGARAIGTIHFGGVVLPLWVNRSRLEDVEVEGLAVLFECLILEVRRNEVARYHVLSVRVVAVGDVVLWVEAVGFELVAPALVVPLGVELEGRVVGRSGVHSLAREDGIEPFVVVRDGHRVGSGGHPPGDGHAVAAEEVVGVDEFPLQAVAVAQFVGTFGGVHGRWDVARGIFGGHGSVRGYSGFETGALCVLCA